jgi:hypothetical protein
VFFRIFRVFLDAVVDAGGVALRAGMRAALQHHRKHLQGDGEGGGHRRLGSGHAASRVPAGFRGARRSCTGSRRGPLPKLDALRGRFRPVFTGVFGSWDSLVPPRRVHASRAFAGSKRRRGRFPVPTSTAPSSAACSYTVERDSPSRPASSAADTSGASFSAAGRAVDGGAAGSGARWGSSCWATRSARRWSWSSGSRTWMRGTRLVICALAGLGDG